MIEIQNCKQLTSLVAVSDSSLCSLLSPRHALTQLITHNQRTVSRAQNSLYTQPQRTELDSDAASHSGIDGKFSRA